MTEIAAGTEVRVEPRNADRPDDCVGGFSSRKCSVVQSTCSVS